MARMRVGTLLLFFALVGAPRAALAVPGPNVQYTAGENELQITSDEGTKKQAVENCSGKSALVHENKLYVACGESGVLIFSLADPLAPTVSARWPIDGVALEVLVVNGELSVKTQQTTVKPLKPAPRTTFAPWTAPPVAQQAPCPTWEPPPKPPSKWPKIMAPPRLNVFSVGSELHAWIPVGSGGAGVAADAHVTARIPWAAFHAHLWPLALSFNDRGNQIAVSALGGASLDTEFFELGLAAGGMTYNVGPRANSAFLLSTITRIGSVDGLAMTGFIELSAADRGLSTGTSTGVAWDFSGFRGNFQIPLGETVMMMVRGAGTLAGFGSGDLALRYRFRGTGGRGSLYGIVGAGGYGVVFAGVAQVGPAISVGMEWRP
jgi:hypothetical protein